MRQRAEQAGAAGAVAEMLPAEQVAGQAVRADYTVRAEAEAAEHETATRPEQAVRAVTGLLL